MTGATLTTSGSGAAAGVPDALRLTISVTTTADRVSDALAGCAAGVRKVSVVARRFARDEDIGTRGLDIGSRFDERRGGGRFQASQALDVMCKGYDKAAALVTELVDEVGDDIRINGIQPLIMDTSELEVEARRLAFQSVRAKAEELAALAGKRLGEVVEILEGAGRQRQMLAFVAQAASASMDFEPGTTSVSATLTVTWQLLPD
jgi:uncharacterized protein